MSRTNLLQEIRKMRFEEASGGWQTGRLRQEEARLPGVCERTFRCYVDRYENKGLQGLIDKRLEQVSHWRAPVDEAMALVERYRRRQADWNVKPFHAWYQRDGGKRSYTWVKNQLQEAGMVQKEPGRGKHRTRAAWPGMMLHQDASTHEWVPGVKWDLVVTMDDATNEHYSMRLVAEEGTASSFMDVRDVIRQRGLFASLYTDRGSHYWYARKLAAR